MLYTLKSAFNYLLQALVVLIKHQHSDAFNGLKDFQN